MKILQFYSKLHKYDPDTEEEIELTSDRGLLLEPISREWYGDKKRGLAMYLKDDLNKKVEYIHYSYASGGYIEFVISCDDNVEEDVIKKFLSGQISDGWGENGIYIVESGWIGDSATVCYGDYQLIDREEYIKILNDTCPDAISWL